MSETPRDGKKNNDMDVSMVMDKIVEDTIGHIDVVAPTPIKKQRRRRLDKKSNATTKKATVLPEKKTVKTNKKTANKDSEKAVSQKKEVQLFFPTQNKTEPAKVTKPTKVTKQAKGDKAVQVAKGTKSTKGTKSAKVAKPAREARVAQAAKPAKQAKSAKPAKANSATSVPKSTKSTKSAPTPKPAKNKATQVPKKDVVVAVADNGEPVKKKHILRTVLLSLFCVAVLAGIGVYGYYAYYYYDKFIPGTVINQIDVHEMTAKEAEEQIRQRVEDYAIEVDFRDGKKQTIAGDEIDYAFVSDGSVDKIIKEQNFLLWIVGYFTPYHHEVSESISFDDVKLREQYNELEPVKKENQIKPENAYVHYQNENFEIIPEIEGTAIDDNILYKALSTAIQASERTCSAEAVEAYKEPQIRSDNAELITEKNELAELVDASIMYDLPQGDKVLDGNMLRTWLEKDAEGHYVMNEEAFNMHLKAFVAALAEETDTYDKEVEFTMTGGKKTMVKGKYGFRINQEQEIIKLQENIANKEKVERSPVYLNKAKSSENNGFGDTYIEVNLNAQHLYVYEKGRLVLESDFVSGRMISTRWTPPGIFTLTSKQKGKVLRGPLQPDGSYEWESPVTYWMPFNRGIGFHDASWRSTYGGTIYMYSGSHGCINMPYKKAKALYEIINKDIPIICFYPDGYKVR